MNAMVISAASDEQGTSARYLREELVLNVGLALLEDQRNGLFNEIDKQLAILSGAAAPAAIQAPRTVRDPLRCRRPFPPPSFADGFAPRHRARPA